MEGVVGVHWIGSDVLLCLGVGITSLVWGERIGKEVELDRLLAWLRSCCMAMYAVHSAPRLSIPRSLRKRYNAY